MIQVAILTLNERRGSTRQEIWKCIDARFPEANRTSYMVAMKKLLADGSAVKYGKNRSRITLENKFLGRALRRMKKGLPLKMVLSSKHMSDLVKKKMKKSTKPKKQAKKAKKAMKPKAKAKSAKGKKGAAAKPKPKPKDKAAKSAKDKVKAKAK